MLKLIGLPAVSLIWALYSQAAALLITDRKFDFAQTDLCPWKPGNSSEKGRKVESVVAPFLVRPKGGISSGPFFGFNRMTLSAPWTPF